MALDDNQRYVIRNEEVVEQEPVERTVVEQTETTEANRPVGVVPPAAQASTVQTTTTTDAGLPASEVHEHNYAERVVDPAADRAAAVDWVDKLVWFVVGVMAVLLAIRFVLLLAGANESAGFAQLIYGLTGWMVAPFAGLFGSNVTYPGTASTAVFEPEALVAIVVYLLVGWLITKLAQLMLGTNRTTGTVYNETERRTKL